MAGNTSLRWMAALASAAVLSWTGCGMNGSNSPTATDSGTSAQGNVLVRLSATGSSSPAIPGIASNPLQGTGIAQLFITFNSIRLYPQVADYLDADSLESHGDSLEDHHGHHHGPGGGPADTSYIEIMTDPVTVDVTSLADTLGTLLASGNVPAGSYSHLALRLTAADAVTDSGAQVPVTPANPDSLLRILSPFTVVAGQTVVIQIRIDLARSVHEVPPGSGHYVLKPVLSCGIHAGGEGDHGAGNGNCGGGGDHGHGGDGGDHGAGDDSTGSPAGHGHHHGRG